MGRSALPRDAESRYRRFMVNQDRVPPVDTLLDEAERRLAEHGSIAALDFLIENLRGVEQSSKKGLRATFFARLKAALVQASGFDSGGVAFEDVIGDQSLSEGQRGLVAGTLARVVAAGIPKDEPPTFRPKALKAIERAVADAVYRSAQAKGAPKAPQSHEKEILVRDAVSSIEDRLESIVSDATTVVLVPQIMSDLLRLLNDGSAQALLLPFLATDVRSRVKRALQDVQSFVDMDEEGRGAAFSGLIETLHSAARDEASVDTAYGRSIARVYENLASSVEREVASSAWTKEPVISVAAAEKKYALSTAGNSVLLRLELSNTGEGPGHDVSVHLQEVTDLSLSEDERDKYLGQVGPGKVHIVEFQAVVTEPATAVVATIRVTWQTFGGRHGEFETYIELRGQDPDVDWLALSDRDPFSIEPVSRQQDLVGRDSILRELAARASAARMGSSYVFGQKRVGKTSIVKTLKSNLDADGSPVRVIILEEGLYGDPDPSGTIRRLGVAVCRAIKRAHPRYQVLDVPVFDGTLSPLAGFLQDVLDLTPEFRALFILDEFDEVPQVLYRSTEIGNQFFQAIRTVSGMENFGFILVGGERMEFVIDFQGERLNKFRAVKVDYFDRERNWRDFADLVRAPVSGALEISDAALPILYEATAGNPFFTKLICQEMVRLACDRRDAHVTEGEMRAAVLQALARIRSNSFQHFWDDGILDQDEQRERTTLDRKCLLVCLAEELRDTGEASAESLIAAAKSRYGLSEVVVRHLLADFARRDVLRHDNGRVRCVVGLFERWLVDRGVSQLRTTLSNAELERERAQQEETARVQHSEISALLADWGTPNYKGRVISVENVQMWLQQFGDPVKQRMMFKLLQHTKFRSKLLIRQRMQEVFDIVKNQSPGLTLDLSQTKRAELLISHLDGVAKSSNHYAREFVNVNNIYARNAVPFSDIGRFVENDDRVQVLLFIDDFIGTGRSAQKQLAALDGNYGTIIRERGIHVFLHVLIAFENAIVALEREIQRLDMGYLRLRASEILTDQDRCFGSASTVFPDQEMRLRAEQVALDFGKRLQERHPLGHDDSQCLIVFDSSCPNNTLPILWAEKGGWVPLFPR